MRHSGTIEIARNKTSHYIHRCTSDFYVHRSILRILMRANCESCSKQLARLASSIPKETMLKHHSSQFLLLAVMQSKIQ